MEDIEVSDDTYIITKETAERYLNRTEQPPDTTPEPPPIIDPKPLDTPPEPPVGPEPTSIQAPRALAWTGEVPTQKWMNFYTKVLTKFATDSDLKLTLKVEVAPEGGVSNQRIEETKLALRELGLNDDVETT